MSTLSPVNIISHQHHLTSTSFTSTSSHVNIVSCQHHLNIILWWPVPGISRLFLSYFSIISQKFLAYFPFLIYFSLISHLFLGYFLFLIYISSISQPFPDYFTIISHFSIINFITSLMQSFFMIVCKSWKVI